MNNSLFFLLELGLSLSLVVKEWRKDQRILERDGARRCHFGQLLFGHRRLIHGLWLLLSYFLAFALPLLFLAYSSALSIGLHYGFGRGKFYLSLFCRRSDGLILLFDKADEFLAHFICNNTVLFLRSRGSLSPSTAFQRV